MRTLEVKDPNLRDIMPTIAQVAVITAATAGLGNLFSTMYANAGLSAGATAGTTGATAGATGSITLAGTTIPYSTAAATATTVQAGSAAAIAGKATAAALLSAARGGTIGDALQAAVMAGGSEFLDSSPIVESTIKTLKDYFQIPDGIEINAVLGNPATGVTSATNVLQAAFEVIGSGGVPGTTSGVGAGALCFAPPCEPGTVFVGNAFSGVTTDDLVTGAVASGGVPTTSVSASSTAVADSLWNEFVNNWYNYVPEDGETTDPNANLPGFEILPNDSEPLKLAKALANSFNDAIFPQVAYNKNTGEWEESYQLSNWLQENVQKFADDIDENVLGAAKEFLKKEVDNAEQTVRS